jgi:hypothetical protein
MRGVAFESYRIGRVVQALFQMTIASIRGAAVEQEKAIASAIASFIC